MKHEKSCQSILSFGCMICETKFTNEEQLKRHEKVHVNERLQCDICLKTFTHPNGFAQHKKSHIEQRFECSEDGCEQIFRTMFNLKKHVKSHKEIKRLDFQRSFLLLLTPSRFAFSLKFSYQRDKLEDYGSYSCITGR